MSQPTLFVGLSPSGSATPTTISAAPIPALSLSTNSVSEDTLPSAINAAILSLSGESASAGLNTISSSSSTPSITIDAASVTTYSNISPGSITNQLSPTVSNPSQTVLVFTTILPSNISAILSSIRTQSKILSAVSAETTTALSAAPTAVDAAIGVEVSIIAALTSAGIPPSAAESLGALILGSAQNNDQSTGNGVLDQQRRIAGMEAVMRWLLSYFQS